MFSVAVMYKDGCGWNGMGPKGRTRKTREEVVRKDMREMEWTREMAGDKSLQALQRQDGDEPLWA